MEFPAMIALLCLVSGFLTLFLTLSLLWINARRRVIAYLESERQDCHDREAEILRQKSHLEEEAQAWREKIRERDDWMSQSRKDLQDALKREDDLKKQAKSAENTVEALGRELEEIRGNYRKAGEDWMAAQTNHEKIVSELREKIHESKREVQKLDQSVEHYERKVEELREEMDSRARGEAEARQMADGYKREWEGMRSALRDILMEAEEMAAESGE